MTSWKDKTEYFKWLREKAEEYVESDDKKDPYEKGFEYFEDISQYSLIDIYFWSRNSKAYKEYRREYTDLYSHLFDAAESAFVADFRAACERAGARR